MPPTDQPDRDHTDDQAAGAGTKRVYVKPAFQHERTFETMALACGKVSGTTQQCNTNRKNS
jgi:hypothetical protein